MKIIESYEESVKEYEYLENEIVKRLANVLSKNFTKEESEEISCLIKYMIDDAIDSHKYWMHPED